MNEETRPEKAVRLLAEAKKFPNLLAAIQTSLELNKDVNYIIVVLCGKNEELEGEFQKEIELGGIDVVNKFTMLASSLSPEEWNEATKLEDERIAKENQDDDF